MENKSLRKCIICGDYKPQKSFIKITRNHCNNEIIVNPNSKIFGRSAYLCYNQNCIEQAIKKKKINKALKISMSKDLKGLLDGQFKG
ncbi:YlxR family protein [bacterium]|nr:YlxR family protein [bacterium]